MQFLNRILFIILLGFYSNTFKIFFTHRNNSPDRSGTIGYIGFSRLLYEIALKCSTASVSSCSSSFFCLLLNFFYRFLGLRCLGVSLQLFLLYRGGLNRSSSGLNNSGIGFAALEPKVCKERIDVWEFEIKLSFENILFVFLVRNASVCSIKKINLWHVYELAAEQFSSSTMMLNSVCVECSKGNLHFVSIILLRDLNGNCIYER